MKRPIIAMLALAAAFTSTMAHGQNVPAVPQITRAAPDFAGSGRASLSWRNPQDATITGYQVRFGTGSPPTFNAWATVTVTNHGTGTNRTLTNGARSAIEVRAVNSVGNGPAARVWLRMPASPAATVNIPDAALRTRLFGTGARTQLQASGTLGLPFVWYNLGIADLTGINYAINTPFLPLNDNQITDISPLLTIPDLGLPPHCGNCRYPVFSREYWTSQNTMTGGLLWVNLNGNPLNAASVNTHIPALRRAGVTVLYDGGAVDDDTPPPPPNDPPETIGTIDAVSLETGRSVAFNGRDYFNDPDGYITGFSGSSSNPAVATVEVGDWDTLTLTAVAEGLAEVTLSATDSGGLSSSLSFMVTVGNPASLGGAGELSAFASAPEGGVVELNVSLAKPRDGNAYRRGSLAGGNDNVAPRAAVVARIRVRGGGVIVNPDCPSERDIRVAGFGE